MTRKFLHDRQSSSSDSDSSSDQFLEMPIPASQLTEFIESYIYSLQLILNKTE